MEQAGPEFFSIFSNKSLHYYHFKLAVNTLHAIWRRPCCDACVIACGGSWPHGIKYTIKVPPEMLIYYLNWSHRWFVIALRNLESFFFVNEVHNNLENRDNWRNSLQQCSPQFHAVINSFHTEIQHCWFAISFVLLNF